jgi:hypothetical protein
MMVDDCTRDSLSSSFDKLHCAAGPQRDAQSMTSRRCASQQSNPIERLFAEAVRELKHHTNPANHRPIHIEPIAHPVQRAMVMLAGFGALSLAGVGAVTPIMPVWPFVLVALFCFARGSARVRNWMINNHVVKSAISLVWARPERPFVWARRLIEWLSGASDKSNVR